MKQWFIIEDNNHLGPYTERNLINMYEVGKIFDETEIWLQGMDGPTSYKVEFLDPLRGDEPEPEIELPPIPEDELKTKPVIDIDTDIQDNIKDIDNEKHQKLVKKVIEGENLDVDIIFRIFNKIRLAVVKLYNKLQSLSLKQKIIPPAILLLVVSMLFGWSYYSRYHRGMTRPSGMTLESYKKLSKLTSSKSSKNQFEFTISKDKSNLWVGTNNPYYGKFSIKIESLPARTLGNQSIIAEATGTLENKLITFDNIQFKKGKSITDGIYEVRLVSTGSLKENWITQLYDGPPKRIQSFSTQLLSSLSKIQFENTLSKDIKSRRSNDFNFWQDLQQKYETLKIMSSQINEELKKVFDHKNAPFLVRVKEFENTYTKKFGNFFTNFVISNENSYKDIKNKRFSNANEIIAEYTYLNRIAKSLGSTSMHILNRLENSKNISDSELTSLRNESTSKLENLVKLCTIKLLGIQKKLISKETR